VNTVAETQYGSGAGFGGHSLPKGGAQALVTNRARKEEVMAIGGCATVAALIRYWGTGHSGAEQTSRSMLQ